MKSTLGRQNPGMTDAQGTLRELLAPLAGQGVASVSIILRTGAAPLTYWVPQSNDEPAFLAYSITKTLIAALVLKLCEEGSMHLEDPLARWFPGIDRAEQITVRRLLNHTGGIPDYGGSAAYHASVRSFPSTPWSFERFAEETFDKGLSFEPGEGWAYSNPGYMLVRRIIEMVAGARLRDLVAARIAGPLGLRRTFVPESVEDLAALSPGASCALAPGGVPRDVRHAYHPGWVSHGVVASTSSEIVRFLDALFQGQFLSQSSRAQMFELVAVPGAKSDRYRGEPSYGLGLMADQASPWGLLVGHNGGGPGYSASAFHAVDLGGASVCVMAAIEGSVQAVENVVFAMLDYVGQNTAHRAPTRLAPDGR